MKHPTRAELIAKLHRERLTEALLRPLVPMLRQLRQSGIGEAEARKALDLGNVPWHIFRHVYYS